MRDRGFTLVELLVVIVILGLIALVVYPNILEVISSSRNDTYNSQVKIIEKAAKSWGVQHPTKLPDSGSCSVKLSILISDGYIANESVKNPKGGGNMSGCVEISFQSNQYVYKYISDNSSCPTGC